jgi:hypothetical protein
MHRDRGDPRWGPVGTAGCSATMPPNEDNSSALPSSGCARYRSTVSFGPRRREWQVADRFGDRWHISLGPTEERGTESEPDWRMRAQIAELVYSGFAHQGAVDDRIAAPLLEIYDALTNAGLSNRLPRPTHDPLRLLVDFDRDLRRELVSALMADCIRIEPVARAPWPFPDAPELEAEALSERGTTQPLQKKTFVALQLVGEDDSPVPGERYEILLPDGTTREGALDGAGKAMIEGIDAGKCTIRFPDLDKSAWEPI